MADLGGQFDATVVEPNAGLGPIPAGKYRCAMVKSEWKDTKKKDGQYLECTFEVLAGEFKGKKLWARLNLKNKSPDAVRISQGELSAICHATGILKPKDSHELHNVPLIIAVKVKKRTDNGENTNEIDGYESTEKASPTNGQAAQPVGAGAGAEPAPWEK